ncbi:Hsp20/alpha crystallin family protein [Streptomyces sp. NPDC056987]|uniref:Hsp20/alpha crystallin family protein n=1 Tax=Streptomyces sp. NPDC056987 TaxID=3345988 RepID=UPI003634CC04
MSGKIERRMGWPSGLPDLLGWAEEGAPWLHQVPGLHSIRIEESLTDGTYALRAELPGIDPAKDLELTVAEGILTLRAERSSESEEKNRTEFHYGTFMRSVRLPPGARGEEATAAYKDGVLTVSVPVPGAETATRTIPVQHD